MFYNSHLVLICIVNYYIYRHFLALHISIGFVDIFLISHYIGNVCYFFNLQLHVTYNRCLKTVIWHKGAVKE